MESIRKCGVWAAVLVLSLLSLAGCGGKSLFKTHRVENQPDAGAVNLAVTMIAPWEDYVEALSPNFSLRPDEALDKVIPQTSVEEQIVFDSLAASLQMGLPESITTSKAATYTGAEGTTSTAERAEEKKPGTLPGLPSVPPDAASKIKDIGRLPEVARRVSTDPMLEYNVATALYQEVQLLNRYVRDAARRRNHRAYIVRIQINVVPYARHQPYDVYTTLGFFAEYKDGDKKQYEKAYVVPLLVTDNLEGTLKSRTVDTVRQLALAVSFLQSGVTGKAGLSKMHEELQSVLGTDINSLLTVGRITDSTIQARLGAARESTAGHAMLPRTHNITMVVMVPDTFPAKKEAQVRIVSNTVMRDAETGMPLIQQPHSDWLNNIQGVLERYLEESIPEVQADNEDLCLLWDLQDCSPAGIKNKAEERFNIKITDINAHELLCRAWHGRLGNGLCDLKREAMDELFYTVLINDYEEFVKVLKVAKFDRGFERDLWMKIAETLSKSELSSTRVDLPSDAIYELPDGEQEVLLIDNAEEMRVRLMGGRGLIKERTRAVLKLPTSEGNEVNLAATSIEVGLRGGDPVLVFPSAAAWNIDPAVINGTELENATLTLHHGEDIQCIADKCVAFENIRYMKKEKAIKPAFAMRRAVELIKADKGYGKFKVYVEFARDEKGHIADEIRIAVDGAEIETMTSSSEGKLSPELNKVVIHKSGTLEFALRNLDMAKKVVLKATALKNKRSVGSEHDDLKFDVKGD